MNLLYKIQTERLYITSIFIYNETIKKEGQESQILKLTKEVNKISCLNKMASNVSKILLWNIYLRIILMIIWNIYYK